MLEFSDSAIADRAYQALRFQIVQRTAHFVFFQLQHRIAIGLLIGGIHQRVQRERVILRSGDLFFNQRTEDPRFDGRERKLHANNDSEHGHDREKCWSEKRTVEHAVAGTRDSSLRSECRNWKCFCGVPGLCARPVPTVKVTHWGSTFRPGLEVYGTTWLIERDDIR